MMCSPAYQALRKQHLSRPCPTLGILRLRSGAGQLCGPLTQLQVYRRIDSRAVTRHPLNR